MKPYLISLLQPILAVSLWAQAPKTIPANATAVKTARGWECDSGYVERKNSCVALRSATDAEVKQYLIAESLRSYPGNCPCPYNVDRAGRSCGRRSAYSRPGGRSPKCYDKDISDAEVKTARERFKKTG